MSIWTQKSALMQPRTSPLKFDHFVVKSEKGSISNLSTKVSADVLPLGPRREPAEGARAEAPLRAPEAPGRAHC